MPTDLDIVVAERKRLASGQGMIERDTVLHWMEADDINVLGAVYHTIANPQYTAHIRPPLTLEQYRSFLMHYFGRCFREDPQGDWSSSRHVAGTDLVNWLVLIWKDHGQNPTVLEPWKTWLAELYRTGDEALRACIVRATLEHLFEQRGMRRVFADWKRDPTLRHAYEEAAEWVRHGGTSPLGKVRGRKHP
jgi:hypothetical protein